MVRPVNGQDYDTYIYGQYFDLTVDGAAGADDTTLAAIDAINRIPERVTYEHKAIVEAARAAYTKIATTEQQALVTNYAALVSAEQRIIQLTPSEQEQGDVTPEPVVTKGVAWLAWVVIGLSIVGIAAVALIERKRENAAKPVEEVTEEIEEETVEEAPEASETEED